MEEGGDGLPPWIRQYSILFNTYSDRDKTNIISLLLITLKLIVSAI